MHGRLKIKTTAEKEAAERKERTEKALKFKAGLESVLSRRSKHEDKEEILSVTAQLLMSNPDVYTLWNIRRDILLGMKNQTLREISVSKSKTSEPMEAVDLEMNAIRNRFDAFGERELSLSETCLMKNPKSYSAWFQRQFILEIMFEPDLSREILLCNEALLKDDRNFHCWDYRRHVSKLLQIPIDQEISFTTDKINANFSNFSSWYYRSCLITEAIINKTMNISNIWPHEYEMVENAIFTDPSDQSAWFYHRWLTLTDFDHLESKAARNHHRVEIREIVADFSLRLLIFIMNRPVERLPQSIRISCIEENDGEKVVEMSKVDSFVTAIWYFRFPSEFKGSVQVFIPGSDTVSIPFTENSVVIKCLSQQTKSTTNFNILSAEKKSNLNELKIMEPDNKWVNLALACCVEPERKLETYQKLREIDSSKSDYYADMISKHNFELSERNWNSSVNCRMNDMHLTCVPPLASLVHLHTIDLSRNKLKKLSTAMNDLVALKILIADDNLIEYVESRFKLLSLEIISLKRNKLNNLKRLSNILQQSPKLVQLHVAGNSFKDLGEGDVTPIAVWEDGHSLCIDENEPIIVRN